ncbi:MAG: hypothetical protein KDA80_10785 [Planctomycetaceae bacterium]|nr:hypothetical protein [Planctomycetaceae bacterium]
MPESKVDQLGMGSPEELRAAIAKGGPDDTQVFLTDSLEEALEICELFGTGFILQMTPDQGRKPEAFFLIAGDGTRTNSAWLYKPDDQQAKGENQHTLRVAEPNTIDQTFVAVKDVAGNTLRLRVDRIIEYRAAQVERDGKQQQGTAIVYGEREWLVPYYVGAVDELLKLAGARIVNISGD